MEHSFRPSQNFVRLCFLVLVPLDQERGVADCLLVCHVRRKRMTIKYTAAATCGQIEIDVECFSVRVSATRCRYTLLSAVRKYSRIRLHACFTSNDCQNLEIQYTCRREHAGMQERLAGESIRSEGGESDWSERLLIAQRKSRYYVSTGERSWFQPIRAGLHVIPVSLQQFK